MYHSYQENLVITLQNLDSKYYKVFNAEVEKRIKAIPGTATMFQLDQIKNETSRDVGRIQMHETWLKFAQENNIEYTRTARKGVKPIDTVPKIAPNSVEA